VEGGGGGLPFSYQHSLHGTPKFVAHHNIRTLLIVEISLSH